MREESSLEELANISSGVAGPPGLHVINFGDPTPIESEPRSLVEEPLLWSRNMPGKGKPTDRWKLD